MPLKLRMINTVSIKPLVAEIKRKKPSQAFWLLSTPPFLKMKPRNRLSSTKVSRMSQRSRKFSRASFNRTKLVNMASLPRQPLSYQAETLARIKL